MPFIAFVLLIYGLSLHIAFLLIEPLVINLFKFMLVSGWAFI